MSVLIWYLPSDGIHTRSKSWKKKLEAKVGIKSWKKKLEANVTRIQGGWASGEHGVNGKNTLKNDTRWPALGDFLKWLSITSPPNGFNELEGQNGENKQTNFNFFFIFSRLTE